MKINKIILLFLVFSLSVLAQPLKYQISGWIDTDTYTISGKLNVTYKNETEKSLNELVFLLPANLETEPNPYISKIWKSKGYYKKFDSAHTYVVGAKACNEDLPVIYDLFPEVIQKFSLQGVLLRIPIKNLDPGQTINLEMEFLTKTPNKRGDKGYSRDVFYWSSGWHPLLLEPDKQNVIPALYEVELLVPASVVLASGADSHKEISKGGLYKKVDLKSNKPTSSLPLVAGPGLYVKEEQFAGVDIYTYYLRGHEQEAVFAAKTAANVLEYYITLFGPYQRERLSIVEGSSLEDAFSGEGLIVLPAGSYRYYNAGGPGSLDGLLSALVAKEVAKSWFDLSQEVYSENSSWIEEAIRNYVAYQYFANNNLDNIEGLVDRLSFSFNAPKTSYDFQENFEAKYLEEIFFLGADEPLTTEYSLLDYPETYDNRIKTKGFLVLTTLESLIGKEKMYELLSLISKQSKQGAIIDNIVLWQLAEDVSGISLESFFNDFIYGVAYEDLKIEKVWQIEDEDGYLIKAEIDSQEIIDWPVEILWEFADGSKRSTYANPLDKEAVISSKESLKRVTIDPQRLVLDVERLNNTYPRKTEYGLGSKYTLDSTRYSIVPFVWLNPENSVLETGTTLLFDNRFYNGYSYTQVYSPDGSYLDFNFWQRFPQGKVNFNIEAPGFDVKKIGVVFEREHKTKKDIGYTAEHNINQFNNVYSAEYLPQIDDYVLKAKINYDDLLLKGGLLNSSVEISKGGVLFSFGGRLYRPSFAYGIWQVALNAQTTVNKPLNKASTTLGYLPERSGDHAVTFLWDTSFPIAIDKEFAKMGPLFWEDAEGKIFVSAFSAWQNNESPVAHIESYLGAELVLGFNLTTHPFALSVIYAKDLFGPGKAYSAVQLSTRFYREVMGK